MSKTSVNITTVHKEPKPVNQNDFDPDDLNRLCFDGFPNSFYVEELVTLVTAILVTELHERIKLHDVSTIILLMS